MGLSALLVAVSISNMILLRSSNGREDSLDIGRSSTSVTFDPNRPSFISNLHPEEVPSWLLTYITWHRHQRSLLTPTNWMHRNFLILRCIHGADPVCGGLADRITPLPALLHLAADTDRILFIHWDRPGPLSTWLPPRSIDWTLPAYVPLRPGPYTKVYTKWETLVSALQQNTKTTAASPNNHRAAPTVACVRIQTVPGTMKTSDFNNTALLRPVFGLMFGAPRGDAPASSGAATTPYLAAHIRARYGRRPIPPHKYPAVAAWAVACVQSKRKNTVTPVVVVSDTTAVMEAARGVTGVLHERSDNRSTSTKPLHLDKDPVVSTAVDPAAYASVFWDLFRLAQAECVSYGPGGYGRLGAALAQCGVAYYQDGRYQDCGTPT